MQKKIMAISIVLLVFGLLVPPLLSAQSAWDKQDLNTWMEENKQAKRYEGIQNEIIRVFDEAKKNEVPINLLWEKLKEGAAKRVPSDRLVQALKQETYRIRRAMQLIDESGFSLPQKNDRMLDMLKTLSIVFRGDIEAETIAYVLETGKKNGKELESCIECCDALFQINQIYQFSTDNLSTLGSAIILSTLPPSGYSSLASIFLKARVNNISGTELFTLVVNTLQQGGGLIRLKRILQRRIRTR